MVAAEMNSSYRNSVAWQKGMELAALVYKVTQGFPVDERFGLTNQLRRAAVSIPSNIAEGKGRLTTGEFIQFLGIARGSTLEVQTQLELASMLGFGDTRELVEAESLALEELKILNASLATLRAKAAAKKLR
jgi:four helix bundle protein